MANEPVTPRSLDRCPRCSGELVSGSLFAPVLRWLPTRADGSARLPRFVSVRAERIGRAGLWSSARLPLSVCRMCGLALSQLSTDDRRSIVER